MGMRTSPLRAVARLASLSIVGVAGLSWLAPIADAADTSTASTTSTTVAASPTIVVVKTLTPAERALCPTGTRATPGTPAEAKALMNENGDTARQNAGTAYSTVQCFNASGQLVAYGNQAIMYHLPLTNSVTLALGQQLYLAHCASCHGVDAQGDPAAGHAGKYPDLTGLGPATINFWITTGRMPAADPTDVQAMRKPPKLTGAEAAAIAAWINTLQPATPFVPSVNLSTANLADGQSLFALNCAACHTITGGGDALAKGTYAPTLHWATPTQIAEALRTGPGNMPRFTGNLSDAQVRDITAYVTSTIQHPSNIGGLGTGGLGPVAEGFIGLALGVGLLMLVTFWVGDRQ